MSCDHRHVKISADGSGEMAEFSLSEDDLRRFQRLDRSSYTSGRAVTAGRLAPRSRARSRPDTRAGLCPQDHDRSRVRDQGPMAGLRAGAYARLIMSADADSIRTAAADAAAGPLDLLLADAATGMLRRVNPGGSGLRLTAALAGRPRLVAGRGRQLLGELGRIAVGRSQVQPSRRDHRFDDPGWAGNPLLRRTMQAYLAASETVAGVVAEAGLDEADSERVGFVLTNLVDALAPSNNPLLNPAAVKAAIDSGGVSALKGLRNFASDMAVPPRVPSMVEPDAYQVGVDLAVTPGSVILRTPVFELIQYRPATTTVRQVPLVIVPPVINKFYVMDLAPGRSMVEYLVGSGLQVFMISWRNPDARHAKWDLN